MRKPNRFGILPALAALAALSLSGCEFRSHRPVYRFDSGKTFGIIYSAELKADADGDWESHPYASLAEAEFSFRAEPDSSKGQIELTLGADSLVFRSSERGPEEDRYMTDRLRRYQARMVISRTGQVLSLEEEPGLPPVGFSPLNIGRFLIFSLPSFPDRALKQGARWEATQSLLDKFHPDSRIVKRFALSAVRETPEGRLAVCMVELEAYLTEDLGEFGESPSGPPGSGSAARKAPAESDTSPRPSLTGRGNVVFNLDLGRPVSAELELEGDFRRHPPSMGADSSRQETPHSGAMTVHLQEKVSLKFTD